MTQTPNFFSLKIVIVVLGFSLILGCESNQTTNTEIAINETEVDACKLIRDSVDFGTGMSPYDPDKLCLDSVFTYAYFETPAVAHKRIDVIQRNDSSFINWNSQLCSTFLLDGSVSFVQNGKKSVIDQQKDYSIASAFQITCSGKMYLAVFLFQHGISNALPDYKIIVLNSRNQLVRYIENENQLSPYAGCFCDINADGQLDYMAVDRYRKKIFCYTLEPWRLLKNQTIRIKEWIDMIYLWEME